MGEISLNNFTVVDTIPDFRPQKSSRLKQSMETVDAFLASGNQTMCLECADPKEGTRISQYLRSAAKYVFIGESHKARKEGTDRFFYAEVKFRKNNVYLNRCVSYDIPTDKEQRFSMPRECKRISADAIED